VSNCIVSPQNSRRSRRNGKRASNVRAELNGYANSHDEVNERKRIEANGPEEHETKHAQQDHRYDNDDDNRSPKVKTKQDEGHAKDGCHAKAKVENRLVDDRQILFVVDIEDTETDKFKLNY